MAHSRWRQLPNICLVWAHDGHVRILPNILYWPMMAACIFCLRARIGPFHLIIYLTIYTFGPIGRNLCKCRQACIGQIQPIMYLTICTSGTIGGSLCHCLLACNGLQQVTTAAEHMSHVGP